MNLCVALQHEFKITNEVVERLLWYLNSPSKVHHRLCNAHDNGLETELGDGPMRTVSSKPEVKGASLIILVCASLSTFSHALTSVLEL